MNLTKISNILREEKTILLQTDTIIGVVCSALSRSGVKEIYRLKQRPQNKALAILVSDIEMAEKYVFLNNTAREFLNKTESVTVILLQKLANNLAREINIKNQTLALRIPKSKKLQNLIKEIGHPLAATSANISGQKDVNLFKGEVEFFDLDIKSSNKESSIIDCSGDKARIIR